MRLSGARFSGHSFPAIYSHMEGARPDAYGKKPSFLALYAALGVALIGYSIYLQRTRAAERAAAAAAAEGVKKRAALVARARAAPPAPELLTRGKLRAVQGAGELQAPLDHGPLAVAQPGGPALSHSGVPGGGSTFVLHPDGTVGPAGSHARMRAPEGLVGKATVAPPGGGNGVKITARRIGNSSQVVLGAWAEGATAKDKTYYAVDNHTAKFDLSHYDDPPVKHLWKIVP